MIFLNYPPSHTNVCKRPADWISAAQRDVRKFKLTKSTGPSNTAKCDLYKVAEISAQEKRIPHRPVLMKFFPAWLNFGWNKSWNSFSLPCYADHNLLRNIIIIIWCTGHIIIQQQSARWRAAIKIIREVENCSAHLILFLSLIFLLCNTNHGACTASVSEIGAAARDCWALMKWKYSPHYSARECVCFALE